MPRIRLIDLMIVTVIIALCATVMLPVVAQSKEVANRVECAKHLSWIGKGLLLYSNENKGSYPRTMAMPRDSKEWKYNFFTNPNVAVAGKDAKDADPFGDKGPEMNDITGALYLILRTQDIPPHAFLCPSVTGEVSYLPSRANEDPKSLQLPGEPKLDFTKQSNFASPKYLNYSFVNVYPTADAIGKGYKTFITAFSSDFAIAADLNPGTPEVTQVTTGSPRATVKAANSTNHGGEGQNVVYADGHVEFQRTPLCGSAETESRRVADNIYSYGVNTDKSGGDGIVGSPVDAVDSVLLPSAVEVKAAMEKVKK
jgi:prepilin-type processing-associated H-X9-DG protein